MICGNVHHLERMRSQRAGVMRMTRGVLTSGETYEMRHELLSPSSRLSIVTDHLSRMRVGAPALAAAVLRACHLRHGWAVPQARERERAAFSGGVSPGRPPRLLT